MVGSFGSLSTALSAMRYNQVALDVASNNIANAATPGYARRSVVAQSLGGPTVPAQWSRYEGHGDGVGVGEVRRMVDPLLDTRVRREHATLAFLSTQQVVLARIENGIGEPSENGVASAIDAFAQSWQDLANNPGGDAARQQVLGVADSLAQAIAIQVRNVSGEEADQRVHLLDVVDEVNSLASELAAMNQSIFATEQAGTDTGTLRDQRDQAALRLAELTGAVTTVRPDGMYDVSLDGQSLVTGRSAGALQVASGVTPDGSADGAAISFRVTDGSGAVDVVPGGELGAVTEVLTTSLPSYRNGLDAMARDLADAVNARHALGYDAAGAPGGAFFTYDPADPAATLAVAFADPALLAAAGVPGGTLDGGNADLLSATGDAAGAYQRLVNGFGTQVATLNRQSANQASLAGSLDNAWEQQAGVNLDEETVNMLSAQRAYEAAARLMTTLDEMLDTLINRTGIVGR